MLLQPTLPGRRPKDLALDAVPLAMSAAQTHGMTPEDAQEANRSWKLVCFDENLLQLLVMCVIFFSYLDWCDIAICGDQVVEECSMILSPGWDVNSGHGFMGWRLLLSAKKTYFIDRHQVHSPQICMSGSF